MTDNVTHTHRERVSVSGEARSAAPRSRRVLRTGSPLGSLSFCSLTTRCVPSTPVHAGEFELLLGCLRSHFGTYKGPPAPPLAPGGVGALGSTPTPPPPPPAPPGLPAVPGTPLGSRTAGSRGLRVVVVPDDELSSGGAAPSSGVSDVTGPSMGGATASWVAVTPSALDLD